MGTLMTSHTQSGDTVIILSEEQLLDKTNFIKKYISASNAATGSTFDSNANVSQKNLATLGAEINKDINIQINRSLIYERIVTLFNKELADEYIRQINNHEIYVHDETSLLPYCVSVTMYPFLLDGLMKLGGESRAPKHLESYCGSFVNFVFAISSQFAGAVATVEFLTYFDHFARQDYGENYLLTHEKHIKNHLQHVIYALNQPAAARGYQSVFWNISIYDQFYFESMFENFIFPDGDRPSWNSLKKLQEFFLNWFNLEREKAVLTFPVVTVAMLTENGHTKDESFSRNISSELSKGNSFFIYLSQSADSLASCCRLRSEISDNTFSYSLGAGGVSTGSINVITINMNRLVQDNRDISTEVEKIHKYQVAYRTLIEEYKKAGMLPAYDAGFISLDKQYLTIGINGMAEAAEFMGLSVGNNQAYIQFVTDKLKVIFSSNKIAKEKFGYMFNTEFVPAESLGVKNANWDKKDGYFVPRDCYNSYFYIVESEETNTLDKFILHGEKLNKFLDGGSALHLNLEEYPSAEGFHKLIQIAAHTGCNYFCTNIKVTICNECNAINKKTIKKCENCNSTNVDYATRVIGYLKRISNFSDKRQLEAHLRHYHREESSNIASSLNKLSSFENAQA
jgi:ribonucleoside-triphosphate reductase